MTLYPQDPTNPLLPNTTSQAASEFHLAQQHPLDSGLILANDAELRRELTLALAVEQRQAVFGPTTVRFIAQLRIEHAMPSHPGLDASAADLIHGLLQARGLTLRLELGWSAEPPRRARSRSRPPTLAPWRAVGAADSEAWWTARGVSSSNSLRAATQYAS